MEGELVEVADYGLLLWLENQDSWKEKSKVGLINRTRDELSATTG